MSALFDLTGRVALVTGASRGIGRGIALGLAEAGADLVLVARDQDRLDAVAREIEVLGRRAEVARCDVTVDADLERAVAIAGERFGRLDVLVNNAGVGRGGAPEEIDREAWDLVLETNLHSGFRCAQLAHPLFKAAGGGKVVNIGSEYSLFGSARVLPYAVSKGGVIQLTKSLAIAWAPDNIQVNAIIPGWIRTDMTAGVQRNEAMYERILERTPMRRFGEPEECAGAAVFLASAASNFVTGVAIPVDGGYAAA